MTNTFFTEILKLKVFLSKFKIIIMIVSFLNFILRLKNLNS